MSKKTTLATVKSFVRREFKNQDLFIKALSSFDGMVDCVMPLQDTFRKVEELDWENKNNLGIRGAWFVGSSRDSFYEYENEEFTGFEVYNCCGSFLLVTKKK